MAGLRTDDADTDADFGGNGGVIVVVIANATDVFVTDSLLFTAFLLIFSHLTVEPFLFLVRSFWLSIEFPFDVILVSCCCVDDTGIILAYGSLRFDFKFDPSDGKLSAILFSHIKIDIKIYMMRMNSLSESLMIYMRTQYGYDIVGSLCSLSFSLSLFFTYFFNVFFHHCDILISLFYHSHNNNFFCSSELLTQMAKEPVANWQLLYSEKKMVNAHEILTTS